MPSLLARLRGRHSRRSSSDTNAIPPAPLPAASPIQPANPLVQLESPPRRNLVGQKIHPDLDSLLERYSAEADVPQGLKPRRHSVGSYASSGAAHSAPPSAGLPPPSEEHEPSTPQPRGHEPAPVSAVKPSAHTLPQLSLFGLQKSTFGRSKPPSDGSISPTSLHTPSATEGPVPSRGRTLSSPLGRDRGNSSTPVRNSLSYPEASSPLTPVRSRTVAPRRRTKTAPGSYKFATLSASTAASTPHSTPSRKPSGRRSSTPSTQSAKSGRSLFLRLGTLTPVSRFQRVQAADSPGTFGYPTPSENIDAGYPFTFTPSPEAPPMPALDHPELVAAMASRSNLGDGQSRSRTSSQSGISPSVTSTLSSRPSRSLGGQRTTGESLSSAEFRVTKSLRPYASLPKVQQIFGQSQSQARMGPGSSRLRSMSDAQPRRRRSMAMLFNETTTGIEGSGSTEAIAEDEGAQSPDTPFRVGIPEDSRSSTGQPADRRTRADNVPAAIQGRPTSPRPSSFPLDIPSSALGSPFLLQGSDVDCNLSGAPNGRLGEGTGTSIQGNVPGAPASEDMVAPSRSSPDRKSNGSASLPNTPQIASTSASAIAGAPSLLSPPAVSVTAPTPEGSPGGHSRRSASELLGQKTTQGTPVSSKSFGKRKAEDVEVMSAVPKHVQHASFVLPPNHSERTASRHSSDASRAPSSYHTPKRARLSSPGESPSQSLQGSLSRIPKGSWSSHTSSKIQGLSPSRAASRSASVRSSPARHHTDIDRRRSLSQASIPISAIVTPHVPSVTRSSNFHMRDPRRPPRVHPTPWSLTLRSQDEDGSPLHAWFFFIGFVLFPLWWVTSFLPIPRTREVGGTDTEKAVTLDDPQIEHDARTWRFRCRIMAVVSLFTYVPFIVLIAVFVSRRT